MVSQQPECANCDFFLADSTDGRKCSKHKFVMPNVDWHILCKDWQHQGKSVDFMKMRPDELYYYSYATGLRSAFLGKFEQLQRMIVSVSIRYDKEFGWILFPRKYTHFFPAPDTPITLILGNRKSRFQVTNTERNLAVEMFPNEEGNWEAHYHTQQVYMLYSLESTDLLRDWLDGYIEFDRHVKENVIPSFHAFVEVMAREMEYILHPDLLAYHEYLRK